MASITLRDKWRISTGSGPSRLWVEDTRTYKGVGLWITMNRKTGVVNPHDGSMFRSPHDEGSRQWAKVPRYVKDYIAENGEAMLAESYPGTEAHVEQPNTINGISMTGQHAAIV